MVHSAQVTWKTDRAGECARYWKYGAGVQAGKRFRVQARRWEEHGRSDRSLSTAALEFRSYLFAGADSGGDRAAAIYTIVQTAKINDLNPEAYLRDTLAKIAEGHPITRLDKLMPRARE